MNNVSETTPDTGKSKYPPLANIKDSSVFFSVKDVDGEKGKIKKVQANTEYDINE